MSSRRRYLAALAALPLGGCVSELEDVVEATPTDDATAGSTPTPTATPEPTAVPDPTATEPPSATTEGPTPSEEPTGGDGPEAPASVDAEWPMPGYDSGLSNYAPGSTGPTEEVGLLWQVSTGTSLSGPVVANETLYVGGADGDVRAFDARTGEEEWRVSVGGSAGTPSVFDGDLYVPAGDEVVALGVAEGDEHWRVASPDRAGFLVAAHGIYYVADGDEAELVARGRSDGDERWRATLDGPWTPTVFANDESVFVSSGSNSPTPWTFDAVTGEFVGAYRPVHGADFPDERLYHGGYVYAVEDFFGELRAYEVTEGGLDTAWRSEFAGYAECPLAVGADHVYCYAEGGEEPGLYAFARSGGDIEWYVPAGEAVEVHGRPVVTDEAILVRIDEDLRCYDPADGTELWTLTGDGIGAEFVVADGLVFTTDGDAVRAFRST